ncbi:winged helix-turn-helix domain-containing protein [Turicibacter sp. H121]|uniref:winged helix-turn-helix domain-containing protein n=1 Tax=Turicibacter sp. H121 TaxID=1712675 RepID=UPI001187708A
MLKREFDVSFTKGGMKDLLLRLGFTYSLARASKESKIVSGEYKLIYFDLQLTE